MCRACPIPRQQHLPLLLLALARPDRRDCHRSVFVPLVLSQNLIVHPGAVVLLLLILSALIFACRRRRRISARATSNIIVGGGPQPQPQAYQPYYGPPATKPEWYPAAGDTPYGQVRSTPPPLGEAQRTTPVREEQRTASTSQVQRTVLPDQAQRTPLRDQTQRVPSGQVQSGTAGPSGRTQNIASPVRPQEPQGPQRAAALNGRESPPPYSPVSRHPSFFVRASRLVSCPHNHAL